MAGTLLLISKDKRNTEQFPLKVEQLKKYTKDTFGGYFNYIIFHNLNQTSFLIEFRQDKREKFYEDEEGNWLTFEGVVFALRKTLCYNAKDLWELYQNADSAIDFANELDGHFVIKLYDAKNDNYLVINDFIKNKTNYFAENDDYFLFTPFACTAGVIIKPELDLYAFNEFMWRYYILSNRSMLKNVRKLGGATVFSIKSRDKEEYNYWDVPKKQSHLSLSKEVEKMVKSLKETANLISNTYGNACLDFTQGQDSRQIVSSFKVQNLPFVTTTFGEDSFEEVKKVKEIASCPIIPNVNIQLNDDYYNHLWDYFSKAILLGSCEEPGYLLGRILFMREQQIKLGNAVLNGAGGPFYKDCFWEDIYAFNFFREPKEMNIDKYLNLRTLNKNYNDSIFKENFLNIKKESRKYFREMIENNFTGYQDASFVTKIDKFSLNHYQNYGIVSNSTANTLVNSISPFLLRRNLEIGLSLPLKWRAFKSQFQRLVMYELDPSLAREKTDFGGINMVPKNIFTYIPFFLRYFWFQSKKLRNKILTKIGFNPTTHLQEAWDYLPVYKLLFQDMNFQKNLIYEDMCLSEIIKEDEWNKFLYKFQNNDFQTLNNFEYLFKIISVEYFMKRANDL